MTTETALPCRAAALCTEAASIIRAIEALHLVGKRGEVRAVKQLLVDTQDGAEIYANGVRDRLKERLEAITRYAQYVPAISNAGSAFLILCYVNRQLDVNLETSDNNDTLEDYFLRVLNALDDGSNPDLTECRAHLFPTDVPAYSGEAVIAALTA